MSKSTWEWRPTDDEGITAGYYRREVDGVTEVFTGGEEPWDGLAPSFTLPGINLPDGLVRAVVWVHWDAWNDAKKGKSSGEAAEWAERLDEAAGRASRDELESEEARDLLSGAATCIRVLSGTLPGLNPRVGAE